MTELESLAMIAGVVAVLALVLYVWDRRTKEQPVDVLDAAKLAIGAGGVAGGDTAVPELLGEMVTAQREQTAAINRLIQVQTA